MKIEFQFNSVQIDPQEIQEQFPDLISMVNSYLPKKKTPKRRKRKATITAGQLINEIIDSIDK